MRCNEDAVAFLPFMLTPNVLYIAPGYAYSPREMIVRHSG